MWQIRDDLGRVRDCGGRDWKCQFFGNTNKYIYHQKMIMTPHKMMMTPQKMMMTPQKMGERLTWNNDLRPTEWGGGLGVVWCITFWLRCILVYHRSGHILYIFYLKHIVSEAKNINYHVPKWQVIESIESRGDQWGADWDEIMEGEDEVPSPGFHQPPSM